jgi:glutathione synthase/RimK-type ligase-like ATP-grasp enzyme
MIYIKAYNKHSESAKLLAALVGAKTASTWEEIPKDALVINWGSSRPTNHLDVINKPQAVIRSINKNVSMAFFEDGGVNHVSPITYQQARARLNAGDWVVQRETDKGKDGDGTTIVKEVDDLAPNCDMYQPFLNFTSEYRVVVFRGKVLSIHRKICDHPIKVSKNDVKWKTKSVGAFSDKFLNECTKAVEALGLDFAGVDIGIHNGTPYIFETNTAFELTPIIGAALANQIRELYDDKHKPVEDAEERLYQRVLERVRQELNLNPF